MRVEMMVDEKVLPKGGLGKIAEELERRLKPLYPDALIRVRKGTNNNLEVYSRDKDEKKRVNKVIEQAFNEADEWLLV
ncbi:DinI-like family protein [Vibrio sp. 10N.222.54.A1]|uniref:DinI-like family protein n=1 Tax=unclassified Vibrio TaxID=2614977 RepID=UPI0010BD72FD|nr:DinI-like family protein [Vibrio sp. F13]TKF85961.1 DinI family protein [Vibrio sp. F13]